MATPPREDEDGLRSATLLVIATHRELFQFDGSTTVLLVETRSDSPKEDPFTSLTSDTDTSEGLCLCEGCTTSSPYLGRTPRFRSTSRFPRLKDIAWIQSVTRESSVVQPQTGSRLRIVSCFDRRQHSARCARCPRRAVYIAHTPPAPGLGECGRSDHD